MLPLISCCYIWTTSRKKKKHKKKIKTARCWNNYCTLIPSLKECTELLVTHLDFPGTHWLWEEMVPIESVRQKLPTQLYHNYATQYFIMLHADSLCILHVDMTVSYIFHLTHLNSEEINKRANIIHNIIILSGSLALRDEGATYPFCSELATSHLTLSIYFHSVWLAPTTLLIQSSFKIENCISNCPADYHH